MAEPGTACKIWLSRVGKGSNAPLENRLFITFLSLALRGICSFFRFFSLFLQSALIQLLAISVIEIY